MKKYKFRKTFTFDGKRYEIYGDSLQEVYEKMALKKRDLEEGRITFDSNMLLHVWINEVLDTYKAGLGERTSYDVRKRIEKHIIPSLGNLPIGTIKPVHCQKLINSKSGYSKEYINKITQDLHFIFEKAKENKMILENPAENLVKPKGHKTPRRSLTDNERKHFLMVCEDDRFLPFLFMFYCGCRPSEALGIQYMDIALRSGTPFLHIRGTKTDNSDRSVPIPPELMDRIDDHGNPFDHISINRHGKPHTQSSYRSLTKALYRAMNLSMGCRTYRNQLIPPYPLADDFVPYCLRHTYCTDLQKKGIDVRTAQKLMGHADISTTANIYTHQDDQTLLIAAEKMGCGSHTGSHTKTSENV